jgi:GNAT superfamily N-acetyltransferase
MKYPPVSVPKTRAPKGFHWEIRDFGYSVYIQLLDAKDRTVGRITLHRVTERPTPQYETHSHMDEKYRGRGWGTKIYTRAIQWCLERGYRIKSSGSSSDMAARVWKSRGIREKFAIRKHQDPYSDAYSTWFAYTKPSNKLKVKEKMHRRKGKKTISRSKRR